MTDGSAKSILTKVIRVLLWCTGGILALMALLVIALQFQAVQNVITRKIVSSISGKTHTEMHVGEIQIDFPSSVVIHDLYVEDLQGDTLLYAGGIEVQAGLFGLLSQDLNLHRVTLSNVTAHISRSLPDSSFNFDFIAERLSSDTSASTQTNSSGWTISLGKIEADRLFATYRDHVIGTNVTTHAGKISTSFDAFDLKNKIIHADAITIGQTNLALRITKETLPDSSKAEPFAYNLGVDVVSLERVGFQYDDEPASRSIQLGLDQLTVKANKIDFSNNVFDFSYIGFSGTHLAVVQSAKPRQIPEPPKAGSGTPLRVTIGSLSIDESGFALENAYAPRTRGMDFNHLDVTDVTGELADVVYAGNRISALVAALSAREQSGFHIEELRAQAVYDSTHAMLDNLALKTEESEINTSMALFYPYPEAFSDSPRNLKVNINLKNTSIGLRDLAYFQPTLLFSLRKAPDVKQTIDITAQVTGTVDDLSIKSLKVTAAQQTLVSVGGKIRGLPDFKKGYFDLAIREMTTGRRDVHVLVPDTLLPSSMVIPETVTVKGMFKGTLKDFRTHATLESSIGGVSAEAEMRPGGNGLEFWKVRAKVRAFDVGTLLASETLGRLSMDVDAHGSGLDEGQVDAVLNATVSRAEIAGYTYSNLKINGSAGARRFSGTASIQDSNIAFTFDGEVNTSEEDAKFNFKLDLKGADLQALNLTTDDIRVSGKLTSNLTGNDINDVNGTIGIYNVLIIKGDKQYGVDSLLFASVNTDGNTQLSIESAILSANFAGSFTLGDLPEVLERHFDSYFSLHRKATFHGLSAQHFEFRIALIDPTLFTEVFVPDLQELRTGEISGSYNSAAKELHLTIEIPAIAYAGINVDSFHVDASSDPSALHCTVAFASLSNDLIDVENLNLTGTLRSDSMQVKLTIERHAEEDSNAHELLIAGVFSSLNDAFLFRFDPEGFAIDEEYWSVSSDGFLRFGKDGLAAQHLRLAHGNKSLLLESNGESHSPLTITLENFELASIAQVVEKEKGILAGEVDGDIRFARTGTRAFISDLKIDRFLFRQQMVGHIELKADQQFQHLYNVSLTITDNNNNVVVKGSYESAEQPALHFEAQFAPLNLASIQGFTFRSVTRLSGLLRGNLSIDGTMTSPKISGTLRFENAGMKPAYLNSYFRLNQTEISFDSKGINLSSLTLIDSLGNRATLNGHLETRNYRYFSFNLDAHTNNFLILNTTKKQNELFYGTIFMDSDIRLRGNLDQPVIDVDARLKAGTSFTVVKPAADIIGQGREGVVEFVDIANPRNPIMARKEEPSESKLDTSAVKLKGMDLTANLEIDKESELKIIVDPLAGDSLILKGEGTLSFGVDPSGKTSLTGRYEILDGAYQMSFYEFIKRRFEIQKGSSIFWNGGLLEADVNISAIYTAKASPIDLVQNQVKGLSDEERIKYKQQQPFQVILKMKGDLLRPDISFQIDLPPNQRGALGGTVYAKLNTLNQQESELNKQVFALLVLGRFVPENPLQASTGGGFSSLARSSASQILSDQLNKLTAEYIKGVDVNVGVESYEDYSTGKAEGRTRLDIALSKQLFNERVTVQVGGNVDLEGRSAHQQRSFDDFAGDISISYKLTEDGRWQIRVFRKRDYEGAFEGELLETGSAIVFTVDYDKLFGITLKPIGHEGE